MELNVLRQTSQPKSVPSPPFSSFSVEYVAWAIHNRFSSPVQLAGIEGSHPVVQSLGLDPTGHKQVAPSLSRRATADARAESSLMIRPDMNKQGTKSSDRDRFQKGTFVVLSD
jgi:hypothetical protein